MIERLFNNFLVSGSSEESLFHELKEISNMTSVMEIEHPYNITVCSLLDKTDNCWKILEFCPDEMNLKTLMGGGYMEDHTEYITYDEFRQKGLNNDLISEVEKLGFYFKYYDESNEKEHFIIPSPTLQNNILSLRGSGKVKSDDEPINQLWLAANLEDMQKFTLVIRQHESVVKGLAVFATEHKVPRQDEIVTFALDSLRKLNHNIVVEHYVIDSKRTYVELSLPDLKTCVKTDTKRFVVSPSFVFNYSDVGDYAASLTPALMINGRTVVVGELIRILEDNFEENLTNALILLNQVVNKINSTSEEVVEKQENVRRILKKLGFYSAKVGMSYRKLYESYMEDFTDKCSKVEILMEILNMPSVIHLAYMKAESKKMPQYILDTLGKLSGKVFSINFDKECF